MADFNTGSVLQAYDGQLWFAPVGTTLPVDREAALDAAFVSAGWLTEDGLTFNPNLSAGDPIKGWPRGEILLRPAATLEPDFKFSLAQHDSDTLDWITQPSTSYAGVLDYSATQGGEQHRLVLPNVKITEAGEIPFNVSDLIAAEITVGCSRDDTAGYTFAFMIPGPGGTGTTTKSY